MFIIIIVCENFCFEGLLVIVIIGDVYNFWVKGYSVGGLSSGFGCFVGNGVVDMFFGCD